MSNKWYKLKNHSSVTFNDVQNNLSMVQLSLVQLRHNYYAKPEQSSAWPLTWAMVRSGHQLRMSRSLRKVSRDDPYPSGMTASSGASSSNQIFQFCNRFALQLAQTALVVGDYPVIPADLTEKLWELRKPAQLHQVEPRHILYPLLWLCFHRVQIQWSSTFRNTTLLNKSEARTRDLKKSNRHYTRAIAPMRSTSGGIHLSHRWRHCVSFDQPGNRIQKLPRR